MLLDEVAPLLLELGPDLAEGSEIGAPGDLSVELGHEGLGLGDLVLGLLLLLREELGVNTTCGASNVSFGLPNRHVVTGTFLSMAIASGMTSAIMNPMHAEVKSAVMAADVLMGTDRDCAAWIRENRDPSAEGSRGGREGRRRRRSE